MAAQTTFSAVRFRWPNNSLPAPTTFSRTPVFWLIDLGGPNYSVNVFLFSDSSGQPGSPIEQIGLDLSWLGPTPPGEGLVTANSISTPIELLFILFIVGLMVVISLLMSVLHNVNPYDLKVSGSCWTQTTASGMPLSSPICPVTTEPNTVFNFRGTVVFLLILIPVASIFALVHDPRGA